MGCGGIVWKASDSVVLTLVGSSFHLCGKIEEPSSNERPLGPQSDEAAKHPEAEKYSGCAGLEGLTMSCRVARS